MKRRRPRQQPWGDSGQPPSLRGDDVGVVGLAPEHHLDVVGGGEAAQAAGPWPWRLRSPPTRVLRMARVTSTVWTVVRASSMASAFASKSTSGLKARRAATPWGRGGG